MAPRRTTHVAGCVTRLVSKASRFRVTSPAWADSDLVPVASFKAIAECDPVVVDPHKHGLQPYGCGAVLFRDPTVGRFYLHDSPYTYFTSAELHLGEISLECSRAGAAAAALWLTRRVVSWTMDGLGARLAAGQRAALHWRELLRESASLALFQDADLDIVTFLPRSGSVAELSAAALGLFERAMTDPNDPVCWSPWRLLLPARIDPTGR